MVEPTELKHVKIPKSVYMTIETWQRLEELADDRNNSLSGTLQQIINQTYKREKEA